LKTLSIIVENDDEEEMQLHLLSTVEPRHPVTKLGVYHWENRYRKVARQVTELWVSCYRVPKVRKSASNLFNNERVARRVAGQVAVRVASKGAGPGTRMLLKELRTCLFSSSEFASSTFSSFYSVEDRLQ
jgi:hypothetical protein